MISTDNSTVLEFNSIQEMEPMIFRTDFQAI